MPIRKVKGGYKTDNVKGVSKTKGEAQRRLAVIKIRQQSQKKGKRR